MLSADARALRDGEPRVVAAEDLVPGDIVLLESGDRIPADLRLIDVKNLRADEAALTGESVPADKRTEPVVANSTVGDREDMAFSGTLIVSGRAAGVVVATGAETELGRINQMLAAVDALETPLLRQIKDFGHTYDCESDLLRQRRGFRLWTMGSRSAFRRGLPGRRGHCRLGYPDIGVGEIQKPMSLPLICPSISRVRADDEKSVNGFGFLLRLRDLRIGVRPKAFSGSRRAVE
jgi:hypothetical protein